MKDQRNPTIIFPGDVVEHHSRAVTLPHRWQVVSLGKDARGRDYATIHRRAARSYRVYLTHLRAVARFEVTPTHVLEHILGLAVPLVRSGRAALAQTLLVSLVKTGDPVLDLPRNEELFHSVVRAYTVEKAATLYAKLAATVGDNMPGVSRDEMRERLRTKNKHLTAVLAENAALLEKVEYLQTSLALCTHRLEMRNQLPHVTEADLDRALAALETPVQSAKPAKKDVYAEFTAALTTALRLAPQFNTAVVIDTAK